jgi:hypothetical protein
MVRLIGYGTTIQPSVVSQTHKRILTLFNIHTSHYVRILCNPTERSFRDERRPDIKRMNYSPETLILDKCGEEKDNWSEPDRPMRLGYWRVFIHSRFRWRRFSTQQQKLSHLMSLEDRTQTLHQFHLSRALYL